MLTRDWSAVLVLTFLAVAFAIGLKLGGDRVGRAESSIRELSAADESRLSVYQKRAAAMEHQLATGADGPIPRYEFAWGPRKPQWPTSWVPLSAAQSPDPLAVLFTGQSDVLPAGVIPWTGVRVGENTENPRRLYTGQVDAGFVLLWFAPLVVIALSFNVLTMERELGTLPLLLAQGVDVRSLVLAKAGVRGGVVVLIWLLTCTAALFALPVVDTGILLRLALVATAGAVYIGFWLALSVGIAVRTGGSQKSALSLAAAYVSILFVIPALALFVSERAHPVPSRIEMVTARRDLDSDLTRLSAEELLPKLYDSHPELDRNALLPAEGRRFATGIVRREERAGRLRAVEQRFREPVDAQQSWVNATAMLSPAVALRLALEELTGTSRGSHDHLLRQAESFLADYRRFFYPLIFFDREFTSAHYDRIPRFTYTREPTPALISRSAWPCCALLLAALAAVAVAIPRKLGG